MTCMPQESERTMVMVATMLTGIQSKSFLFLPAFTDMFCCWIDPTARSTSSRSALTSFIDFSMLRFMKVRKHAYG